MYFMKLTLHHQQMYAKMDPFTLKKAAKVGTPLQQCGQKTDTPCWWNHYTEVHLYSGHGGDSEGSVRCKCCRYTTVICDVKDKRLTVHLRQVARALQDFNVLHVYLLVRHTLTGWRQQYVAGVQGQLHHQHVGHTCFVCVCPVREERSNSVDEKADW